MHAAENLHPLSTTQHHHTAMPTALPDPVLALSMANLQKLNTADVDQLANLWHLFTKCKESIESGRRLENLSWRLWFREAHVLPPDTSLSDLTDFTPLDTPLMSRRSSLSGSYQPTRVLSPLTPHQPSAPVTHRALQAAALAMNSPRATGSPSMAAAASTGATPLSDPEDGGDWSSDDETADDEGGKEELRATNSSLTKATPASARPGRSHIRSPLTSPPAGVSETSKTSMGIHAAERSTADSSAAKAKGRMASLSSSAGEARDDEAKQQNGPASPAPTSLAAASDRRRATSSSSAFGSRARVKQHNMQRLRRPLSLQQAIESLLLGCEDLTWSATKSRKHTGVGTADPEATVSENEMEQEADASRRQIDPQQPSQSSAPAEFSQPSTPLQQEPLMVTSASKPKQQPEERGTAVSRVDKVDTAQATPQEEKAKPSSSKFFIGSTSFEGSEHSAGSESVRGAPAPTTTGTKPGEASPAKPNPERRNTSQQMRRAPSDAGSNDSSKLHSTRGAHHRAGATGQRHAHPTGHGAAHQLGHLPTRGAHAGARNKSAIGLIRPGAGARGRGHGRVASAVRIAPMTKDDGKHDHDGHGSPSSAAPAPPAAGKETSPLQPKKKRPPVTFTMGSMDDDDSDFEDDEDAGEAKEAKSAKGKATEPAAELTSVAGAGPTETSDEWSSDSSTDSEEERRRTAEERKRAERERLDSMFKKIPIRSKSAADISLLGGEAKKATTTDNVESRHIADMSTSPGAAQNGPPIRSLLSTIFHPESQPELNQAIRRAHASSVDLHAQQHRQAQRAKTSDTKTTLPRPPSTSNLPASFGGALKMSKSAVALPVLSTTGSRSTIKDDVRNSRNSAVFDDDDDDDDDSDEVEDDDHQGRAGAVGRLNELAQAQQNRKQQKQKQLRRQDSNASEHSDTMSARRASTDSHKKKRASNASLDVQVTPDVDEDAIRQQRRTSAPSEMASTPAIAAPDRLPYRSKSAVNVPEVGLPQSPRTTRRNMLRDELSESLRQNLLLERRSRHRMLGIGAQGPVVTSSAGDGVSDGQAMAPPPPPHLQAHNRQQSVLGGNALRPLTARNGQPSLSSSQQNSNTNRGGGPSRYSGDFHQTGW